MLGFGRISTRALAQLCRRLSTSLEAGLEVRSVWAREAQHAIGPRAREQFSAISGAVARGDSLREALRETEGYFPPLFSALVDVGEQTGHLGEAFRQLAEHYDRQLEVRRNFLASIAWPMLQLVASIFIVGFLIWIMGMIGDRRTDPLGFGLVGNRGLAVYVMFVLAVGAGLVALFQAVRLGLAWTRPLQNLLLQIPVLGKALETLILARLAWALHLTMDAGMALRAALRLSLETTYHFRYIDQIPQIEASIARGDSLYEAFRETRAYPPEFLDVIQVGEQSGRLVESLALLSRQYHERANASLKTLTMIAGFLVWAAIAAVIIAVILRLAMFYVGTINSALPQ